jgi:hypothetical protein
MPNPVVYVNALLPVSVTEAEPPKPVQSSKSRPQKGARFNVTYTLYAFGKWCANAGNIPSELRGSRSYKIVKTNSGMRGRQSVHGSAAIVRNIPDSYSDRMTG